MDLQTPLYYISQVFRLYVDFPIKIQIQNLDQRLSHNQDQLQLPLEAAATGTPIIVTEGGSTDDYFNEDFGLQIKSKFINSNNRKYLEPSLESLVENISLIIQNPRKYGNEKSIKFIRDNFSWKKTVEKIYNIFDKNL